MIIQEIVGYKERFLLVFINYECMGILRRVPEAGCHSIDSLGIPAVLRPRNVEVPEHFSGEIVSRLEKLLRSVRLNDIAVEVGMTGQDWQVIEFVRPPISWPSGEGVVDRFHCICRLIESGKLQ